MKNKILIAVLLVTTFTSCVSMHGGMTSSSASLSSNNFTYIAQGVQGSASVTQYVALVPGFRETLINDAKNEILDGNSLGDLSFDTRSDNTTEKNLKSQIKSPHNT